MAVDVSSGTTDVAWQKKPASAAESWKDRVGRQKDCHQSNACRNSLATTFDLSSSPAVSPIVLALFAAVRYGNREPIS